MLLFACALSPPEDSDGQPFDSRRSNFTGQYIGFEMATRVITLHRGGAKFHRRAKQNNMAFLERFANA